MFVLALLQQLLPSHVVQSQPLAHPDQHPALELAHGQSHILHLSPVDELEAVSRVRHPVRVHIAHRDRWGVQFQTLTIRFRVVTICKKNKPLWYHFQILFLGGSKQKQQYRFFASNYLDIFNNHDISRLVDSREDQSKPVVVVFPNVIPRHGPIS